MHKKKLLFVIPEYSHGGTNKSLENLLHFIDRDKYEVSIFCMYEYGCDYFKRLFQPYFIKKSLIYTLAHDNVFTRKIMGALIKLSDKFNFQWLYRAEYSINLSHYSFDAIIAFQEGEATEFASSLPYNVKKVAWIHGFYTKPNPNGNDEHYKNIDTIVCVSKAAQTAFLCFCPQYESKTKCIYNTVNVDFVKKRSQEKLLLPFDKDKFNILSVGRLSWIKQYDLIPEIAYKIKLHTKRPFCWYIMGTGVEQKQKIIDNIAKFNVEEYVKIIDEQENPYPFIKNSDLHVCTSSVESFSYTIAEAKILGVPVVTNDFPVAAEVVDEQTGWICNINDMAPLIADIINDRDGMYTKMRTSVADYDHDNVAIIEKFYKLVE